MNERVDWIDLRSDTVTRPTEAMRLAMAEAEVGDDVYGEDPTINLLEQRAAAVFGREAALFVPTGTMGNQIALKLHTHHGQEVICEARSHVLDWEMGGMAWISGCLPRTIAGERGILRWEQIEPSIAPKQLYYRAQTGLVWLENTHNMAGGTVTPLAVMESIWEGAHAHGLPVHLDGARIFNAVAAVGVDAAHFTRGFDSINFCLSKGLGAPVGSVLVGSAEFIERGRRVRKLLGGGMRQAGCLAAAGLIALEEGPKRLAEDHANARLLAEAVSRCEGVSIDLAGVETNIVIFSIEGGAPALVQAMKQEGVLASAIGPHAVRLVTHRDVSRAQCERAVQVLTGLLAGVAA